MGILYSKNALKEEKYVQWEKEQDATGEKLENVTSKDVANIHFHTDQTNGL